MAISEYIEEKDLSEQLSTDDGLSPTEVRPKIIMEECAEEPDDLREFLPPIL